MPGSCCIESESSRVEAPLAESDWLCNRIKANLLRTPPSLLERFLTPEARKVLRRHGRNGRSLVNRSLVVAARAARLGHYIVLEYPPTSDPTPKTRNEGCLYHAITDAVPNYLESLRTIMRFSEELASIPRTSEDPRSPTWLNDFLPGLDAASIYAFVRDRAPETYLEIGSGTSTRFARRAISDGALKTRITSVDPAPRAEVDQLCDQIVRVPLERADPALFARLKPGDIVFLDGSHRVFAGSDTTVFVLDYLPQLSPGVLVGVHDVYLPDDYPASVVGRFYSEQYLLGALLLGQPSWLTLVLAADFVSRRSELRAATAALWADARLDGITTHGVALWLETHAPG